MNGCNEFKHADEEKNRSLIETKKDGNGNRMGASVIMGKNERPHLS